MCENLNNLLQITQSNLQSIKNLDIFCMTQILAALFQISYNFAFYNLRNIFKILQLGSI